ncbi:hypothetical protein ACFSCV_14340 [Methylopila henanensis]|uniref:YD repeat-containing protein n=1 Tax=Methylopila henanensis TaxID=873516 RepID=A0ABW4KAQ4_9HYPH
MRMRTLGSRRALAVAIALLAGATIAEAGHTKIVRKDGSKVDIVTTGNGTIAKTYDPSGKLMGKKTHSDLSLQTGHQDAIRLYSKPGDAVSTDWSQ